jgi:TP901-1 family phage major tail protein
MAARIGRKIKFRWGAVAPLAEVPGVREKGVTLNGEAVDVTADENNGWRELLADPAENQVEISLSGVTKSHVLKADWFAGTRTKLAEIEYDDGAKIGGTFYLSNYSETGVYNDAATFEATLMSSGVVTYTPVV